MNVHKNAALTPRGRERLLRRIEAGESGAAAAAAVGVSEADGLEVGWASSKGRPRSAWRPEFPAASQPETGPSHPRASGGSAKAETLDSGRHRPTVADADVDGGGRCVGATAWAGHVTWSRVRPWYVMNERTRGSWSTWISRSWPGSYGSVIASTEIAAGSSRGAGWEFLDVCIDDASRVSYAEVLPDEKGITCVAFLERSAAWFAARGIRIERVMTDCAEMVMT